MSLVKVSGNASGTGTLTIAAPNTNSDRTLTLPDGTGTFTVNGVNSNIVSGTSVASTSGTSIDFTGIPSWCKRITVMFNGVSTNGTSNLLIQIGSGSISSSGYTSSSQQGVSAASSSAGFIVIQTVTAAGSIYGSCTISLISGTTYVETGIAGLAATPVCYSMGGSPALSSALDRVRITTVNGTDTFDAGTINILYE